MKKIILLSLAILVVSIGVAHSQATIWADRIVGNDDESPQKIVVDTDGSYYVAGYFDSPTVTFNNGIMLTQTSNKSGFLAKYNSSGLCQWAVHISGNDDEADIRNIALDNDGNIYVTGNFASTTLYFNNNINIDNEENEEHYNNIYLAKYNSSGLCQWAEGIIGSDEGDYIEVFGITVDDNSNVYISGDYYCEDEIVFNEGITLDSSLFLDGFFAKFNSSGECQWAQQVSGAIANFIFSITIDTNYNIYFTGKSYYGDFYFDEDNYVTIEDDNGFGYFAKYNSNSEFQWAKLLSTSEDDVFAYQIAVDSGGDLYISGESDPVDDDGASVTSFVVKYSSSGDFQWKEVISGDNDNLATSMTVSPSGDVYLGGYFSASTLYFNNGISLENSDGPNSSYGFLAKYNNNGDCQWAESIIGNNYNSVLGLAVDSDKNLYVAGNYSADELLFNNDFSLELVSNYDGFIAKYEQKPFATLPIVSVPVKTSGLSAYEAISGAEVVSDGGATVTKRGICLSTSRYPNIDDTNIVAGSAGVGSFAISINDLAPSTKYYIRAYAKNSKGISYGAERSFTTAPSGN